MTSPKKTSQEELHDEPLPFSAELTARLRSLGDRATWLHEYNHGPGGDWSGQPEFRCCFGPW